MADTSFESSRPAATLLMGNAAIARGALEELERVNRQFARAEQVKKFRLLETKLGAEDEELTPTMKLKRKLVNEKYKDLIESMYMKEAA